jgi:hypothetical protein
VRLFIVFTRSYMLTPLTAVTSALRTRPLDDSVREMLRLISELFLLWFL